MNELLQAFVLGNTAILTNVCMLPLYPGLIAFLAGTATKGKSSKSTKFLGLIVLAGVLSLMLGIGWLLYTFQSSFGDILPILLPVIYALVIIMGLLMLSGRNPFAGPLIVSAFLLGAGSAAGLASSMLYFLAFGLGFGWPLIILPLLAVSLQRRFTGWTVNNYKILTTISGVLLVVIGVAGIVFDLAPNI